MKKLFSLAIACCITVSSFAAGHTISFTSVDVSCYGGFDGSATAIVSGGIGPFAYDWISLGATTPTVTGLLPGAYGLIVTDSSDMSTASASVNIYEPTAVTMTLPPSFDMCPGGSCVTLSGSVSGGISPYAYNWSPSTSLSSPVIYTPTACPTVTTTYTVIVTDANGCVTTASTTVNVGAPITLTTTATGENCSGPCNGIAVVYPAGGTGVYTYQWTDPGMQTGQVATGLCPGTYAIVVTDAGGCVAADSAVITPYTPPVANFTMVPDSANANTFWAFNSSYGGVSYAWDFGDGTNSVTVSPSHLYTAIGTYTVCLQANAASGCGDTLCVPLNVTGVVDPCLALFNIAKDSASSNPNAYIVYNLSYGSSLTYLWDFGDTTTSTLANPTHVYSVSSGSYQICLTVDNGSGCTHMYCDSIFSADSLGRSSDPIMFTVVDVQAPLVTGINNIVPNLGVSVYPNPFSDQTTFEIGTSGDYSFELTDVVGKKVMQMNIGAAKKFEISRSGLQNGIYFYTIYSAEGAVNKGKLVVK